MKEILDSGFLEFSGSSRKNDESRISVQNPQIILESLHLFQKTFRNRSRTCLLPYRRPCPCLRRRASRALPWGFQSPLPRSSPAERQRPTRPAKPCAPPAICFRIKPRSLSIFSKLPWWDRWFRRRTGWRICRWAHHSRRRGRCWRGPSRRWTRVRGPHSWRWCWSAGGTLSSRCSRRFAGTRSGPRNRFSSTFSS